MVRLFQFQDLNRIMEIWLEGNLKAHSFIGEEYWRRNYQAVEGILPEAEVYVYEDGNEIRGFIGMDAEYIAGLFVAGGYQSQGIGQQLIETVKKKKRLSLHVYARNERAVRFYQREGFLIKNQMTEHETGEKEYLMVYNVE